LQELNLFATYFIIKVDAHGLHIGEKVFYNGDCTVLSRTPVLTNDYNVCNSLEQNYVVVLL